MDAADGVAAVGTIVLHAVVYGDGIHKRQRRCEPGSSIKNRFVKTDTEIFEGIGNITLSEYDVDVQ